MIYFLKHISFIVERLLYQPFPTCKYLGDKKKKSVRVWCVSVCFLKMYVFQTNKQNLKDRLKYHLICCLLE